ncbi:MAG: hypothetical protein ABSH39_21920 [Candidatus Acidiferrum sp.]|jgi:hypothetical protein
MPAPGFYFAAESKIHAEKKDFQKAEDLLSLSIALDPSAFFVHIELANLLSSLVRWCVPPPPPPLKAPPQPPWYAASSRHHPAPSSAPLATLLDCIAHSYGQPIFFNSTSEYDPEVGHIQDRRGIGDRLLRLDRAAYWTERPRVEVATLSMRAWTVEGSRAFTWILGSATK